jgi:hypothetical protein
MVYSLTPSSPDQPASTGTRDEAAPEVTLASSRQYKVLQSRAAPRQLSLPLGGITITPPSRTTAPAGKPFRTAD